jgi:ADP-ribosyl-[dinitrogen reductase] hydrolase
MQQGIGESNKHAFENSGEINQLLHSENLEEAVADTVTRDGDTDTNAAICGALLGAVFGKAAIPTQGVTTKKGALSLGTPV